MRNCILHSAWMVFIFAVGQSSAVAKMVENFEQLGELGERWTASQGMQLERVNVPPDVRHEGVERTMLKVNAVAGGYFASQPNFPRCRFHAATSVKFRVEAPGASVANPLIFEFQVYSTERTAWRWSKVTLDAPGWRTVELPTRYFRHSPAAYLPFEETRRFAFRFRNAGRMNMDTIELVDASFTTRPGELSLKEIGQIAFGEKATIHRGKTFAVITDEPRLKPDETLAALDQMLAMVLSDFPSLKAPKSVPPLLVFSDEARYRAFWKQLADKFNSQGPTPSTDGFSMLGIAGSYYDPRLGSARPVYLHEASHALMARLFGIASEGDWLHEGLANYYQLHFTKQNPAGIAKTLVAQGRLIPLDQLLNGRPLDIKHYAQAALFIEWIMANGTRKERLLPAIRHMAKQGSTAFAPAAKVHFGASIQRLQTSWLRWMQTR
ncbi:MAG: hypothetical protein VCA36_05530 [Opitutales bacterium]